MTTTTTLKTTRPSKTIASLASFVVATATVVGCSVPTFSSSHHAASAGSATPTTLYVSRKPPVGPTRSIEGTPAGFRHDSAGARAAAIGYVRSYGRVATAEFITRSDIVNRISSTRFAPTLSKRVESTVNDLHEEIGKDGLGVDDLTVTIAPLTAVVTTASPNRVRVKLWGVGIMSLTGSSNAFQTWQRFSLTLVWERGDWRVDDWTVVTGPTPTASDETASATSAEVAAVQDWPAATTDRTGTGS